MLLRTRIEVFSAALLSALGAVPLTACGGSAVLGPGEAGGNSGGAGGATAGSAGTSDGGSSDGGAVSVGGSAGVAAGGASNPNRFPCKDPKSIAAGVLQCDGFKHRTEGTTCASQLPRPYPVMSAGGTVQCQLDKDCSERPHGWCGEGTGQLAGAFCNYGCVTDAECAATQLCECGDPVGRCVAAACKSDADCGASFLCRSYDSTAGCQSMAYTCQSPTDECGSDADCSATTQLCRLDEVARRFKCVGSSCAIGRPFLVLEQVRAAPAVLRADWSDHLLSLPLHREPPALLAHLAEEWTRMALMEHASIAAFARFTLQLLSLGAPAELIERTTSAMTDETRHAKVCFAVAESYAGRAVGPGRLAIENSLDELSLSEIVRSTILEGCIGETTAAIEAREAAEYALDPARRELLRAIAEDETRHAELAFRFVQWALSGGDEALNGAVQREFAALRAEPAIACPEPTPLERAALDHGVLPESMRRAIRARAIEEVILPCSRALATQPVGGSNTWNCRPTDNTRSSEPLS